MDIDKDKNNLSPKSIVIIVILVVIVIVAVFWFPKSPQAPNVFEEEKTSENAPVLTPAEKAKILEILPSKSSLEQSVGTKFSTTPVSPSLTPQERAKILESLKK